MLSRLILRWKKNPGDSGINVEVTHLYAALEELIEQEREWAKIFEVEGKKAKKGQELARSIRQEAAEIFAETR